MTPLAALVLRDVHVPPSLPWWPPAPGWWLVGGVVLAVLVAASVWWLRRWRRRRGWLALFEQRSAKGCAPERIAAMSELLRRAARNVDPRADRLRGEAWLRFLDGRKRHDFSAGPGRLLEDGGYRRSIDETALAPLHPLVRARFLELMAGRR